MKTIVKRQHAAAHALIDGFLSGNKERHGGAYAGDLYERLSADWTSRHTKTLRELKDILLDEQQGLCCYCMRDLSSLPDGEKTVEHVIVNHPDSEEEYKRYLGHGSQLDEADMISAAEFLDKQLPPPPYPHSVAYENLLISCNGRCHIGVNAAFTCNNKRVHTFVCPLPLMPDVEREMVYSSNGFVTWARETNTDPDRMATEVLGLNHDVLRMIRRLWCKMSNMGTDVDDRDHEAIILETLADLLTEGADDATLQLLFMFRGDSWYWTLLKQFHYFKDKF
ncbi:MAG: hypothetical protein HUK02_07200 [Bacteroidaceae bacterium]|nr:hypothetical protein [Bacteroidaceae bacterium]